MDACIEENLKRERGGALRGRYIGMGRTNGKDKVRLGRPREPPAEQVGRSRLRQTLNYDIGYRPCQDREENHDN